MPGTRGGATQTARTAISGFAANVILLWRQIGVKGGK